MDLIDLIEFIYKVIVCLFLFALGPWGWVLMVIFLASSMSV